MPQLHNLLVVYLTLNTNELLAATNKPGQHTPKTPCGGKSRIQNPLGNTASTRQPIELLRLRLRRWEFKHIFRNFAGDNVEKPGGCVRSLIRIPKVVSMDQIVRPY